MAALRTRVAELRGVVEGAGGQVDAEAAAVAAVPRSSDASSSSGTSAVEEALGGRRGP